MTLDNIKQLYMEEPYRATSSLVNAKTPINNNWLASMHMRVVVA
jgi:hypothetical protein